MKHSHIDEFAGDSPLSKVDPRVKFLCLILFLIAAAVSTGQSAVMVIGLTAISFLFISRIPLKHILINFIPVLPILLAVSFGAFLTSNPISAILISARISGSVLVALVFSSTTPVLEQILAMQYFRVPKILTSMMLLTYRFLFLFIDEIERMRFARRARGFRLKSKGILRRDTMKVLGNSIGMLVVRVNDRASRVFDSLRSRGFHGTVKGISPRTLAPVDAFYGTAFGVIALLIFMLQLEVIS